MIKSYLYNIQSGNHIKWSTKSVQKIRRVIFLQVGEGRDGDRNRAATTMPKPMPQKAKILSKYDKVDFEVYFIEENGIEQKVSLD
jgi:hypothetical protein